MSLKEQENEAFENILYILDDISAIPELQWDYRMPFSGFTKYLQEEQIKNYALVLDKEGEQNEASRTMQAACEMGLSNVTEENSKDSCGLRMADMMTGIISKLLKALCDELHYHARTDTYATVIGGRLWRIKTITDMMILSICRIQLQRNTLVCPFMTEQHSFRPLRHLLDTKQLLRKLQDRRMKN